MIESHHAQKPDFLTVRSTVFTSQSLPSHSYELSFYYYYLVFVGRSMSLTSDQIPIREIYFQKKFTKYPPRVTPIQTL